MHIERKISSSTSINVCPTPSLTRARPSNEGNNVKKDSRESGVDVSTAMKGSEDEKRGTATFETTTTVSRIFGLDHPLISIPATSLVSP